MRAHELIAAALPTVQPWIWRADTEASLRERLDLPAIPVFPVGAAVARSVFEQLDGAVAPAAFRGRLNCTYRLTGARTFAMSGRFMWHIACAKSCLLAVHATTEQRRITNVCAYMDGTEAPDQLVLIGNRQ